MTAILQSRLPFAPWMSPVTARLPGVQPVAGEDWLVVDEAYAGQMARRDALIADQPEVVLGMRPEGAAAATELYEMVLARLRQQAGYRVGDSEVLRPDGRVVPLDPAAPLRTLGQLVQEDLCLLQRQGDEHVLTAACLCFPASWSLAEKLGRPMTGIHRPVASYDPDMARRVQRLFDALRPDLPLWRMNALVYVDPELHQPRTEDAPRTDRRGGQYVRAERQTMLRLPQTGAALFAIHTYVVPLTALTEAERAGLVAARL